MLVSFDIETSVRTGEPACLTWCVAEHGADGTWRPGPKMGLHARDPKARATFAAWLADESVVLLGQNVAFDMVTLSRWWGLLPEMRRAYEAGRVRDTMLRQHLIDIAWPAKPNVVWNDELGKFFPGKLAWHRGLGKMIRIDAGENEDGGGAGAKAGLDYLAHRLLAVDIVKLKHGADGAEPVRMRYHEMLDVPWEAWPDDFRDYALGDPSLTLEVYLEQIEVVREKTDPRVPYDDRLPPLVAAGWTIDDVDAPLVDEQFQVQAAVPFQVMSARGVRVDRTLVRKQRAELARLREWAAGLCVRHGTMREVYDFEVNDATVKSKPLRKGESPTPERLYRSLRTRCRKLQAEDPAAFADFLTLARQLGKIRGVERKVDDAEKRARVTRIAGERGIVLVKTKSGKKTKADADVVYDVATPSAEAQAHDPAAADLAAVLGPALLKIARRALAGTDADCAAEEGRTDDATRLRAEADGWSLARLAAAIEVAEDPGLAALAVHGKAEKFDSSFLRGLDVDGDPPEVRAWFRTMMETGRTSMVGAIRQNMPKAGGVRECIVPRPGYVFVQCDYSQIELLALAYVVDSLFGRESSLTLAIRGGIDCHLALACHPLLGLGMTYDAAKAHRKEGNRLLEAAGSDRSEAESASPLFDWALFDRIEKARFNAKAANFGFPGGMMPRKFLITAKKQGVVLTLEQATALRTAWLETWPEINAYFEWAKGMTSGNRTARVRHLDGGADEPGHWRGGCGYTQLCNTLFQGLCARGAKVAAWDLFVACYLTPDGPLAGSHPVLFVHDEFVLEVPIGREGLALPELIRIMVASMLSVMPGQAVRAEGKVLPERWTK
jgi:hypothetical protein